MIAVNLMAVEIIIEEKDDDDDDDEYNNVDQWLITLSNDYDYLLWILENFH